MGRPEDFRDWIEFQPEFANLTVGEIPLLQRAFGAGMDAAVRHIARTLDDVTEVRWPDPNSFEVADSIRRTRDQATPTTRKGSTGKTKDKRSKKSKG